MKVAKVAIDRAGERTYDYAVPEGMTLGPGSRVRVPFRTGERIGTVVGLPEATPGRDLKPVLASLGEAVEQEALDLARFVADTSLVPIAQALTLVLPPPLRRSRGGVWALRRPPEEALREASLRAARAPGRSRALRALAEGPVSAEDLGVSAEVLRTLRRQGWVERRRRVAASATEKAPALTPDQEAAVARLRGPGETLLFGVTGSGKTEVYMAAMAERIAVGEGTILLVPEIALTPQLIERFQSRFGDTVATLHSRLSAGERAGELQRIREGRARVVIGVRSAVFAPVPNLGLIVLDEAHESSYQQDEAPRYHALDIARHRMVRSGGRLALGSATPDVVAFHRALSGETSLAELAERFGPNLPTVTLVDLRKQSQKALSAPLLDALREAVGRGDQAILFLNRRGFRPVLLCRDCGTALRCPHCDVSVVLHQPEGRVVCHQCGFTAPPPTLCPACQGRRILPIGLGTQRLEAMVREALPKARVLRLDQDTVTRQGSYESIYTAFREREADILVGTQMVAKGFDFPGVGLVGVVLADQSLRFPDYRAAERTFQLVAQVAGRAGRREAGRVVVQTFDPGHYALQHAARHDYKGFFSREIEGRREAQYPPFVSLLLVGLSGPDAARVEMAAGKVAEAAAKEDDVTVLGPAPAMVARVRDRFRWQVLLKHPRRERLLEVGRSLSGVAVPSGVRRALLFDPLNLL